MRLLTIILCMAFLLCLAALITEKVSPTLSTYDKAEARLFRANCNGDTIERTYDDGLMELECVR